MIYPIMKAGLVGPDDIPSKAPKLYKIDPRNPDSTPMDLPEFRDIPYNRKVYRNKNGITIYYVYDKGGYYCLGRNGYIFDNFACFHRIETLLMIIDNRYNNERYLDGYTGYAGAPINKRDAEEYWKKRNLLHRLSRPFKRSNGANNG